MMNALWQDLHYGARILLKKPGFTLIAVITLALGIGANTAIFSVVNAVLLKPAPYRNPDRIVQLVRTQQGRQRTQVPPAEFMDWREQNQVFESVGASQWFDANLSGGELPERVRGVRVTASVFALLGVDPLIGRWPRESEDQAGAEPVAVIGYSLWQRYFGADPQIIDKTVKINSRSHTVIGVMPEGFKFPAPYFVTGELWVLSGQQGMRWDDRKTSSLLVFARLKDGTRFDQAQAEMDVIAERLAQQHPETNKGIGVMLTSYGGASRTASRSPLLLLFAAASLLLLIACVNVVNLLLSRGIDRSREIAIRAALGARRWRLVRQLLTESLLLFTTGGLLGLLAAMWGIELIVTNLRSYYIPRMEEASVDATVAGFSLMLSLIVGVAAGLFPALKYSEVKLTTSLNEQGRSGGAGSGARRFQKVLIVSEVSLTLILMAGAGLLVQSFRKLSQVDLGFRVESLRHMRVSIPAKRYPGAREQAAFLSQAVEQIGALPGVTGVCAVDVPPGVGAGADQPFSVAGDATSNDASQKPKAALRAISADYFRTLEVPLREGRAFTPADTVDRPRVAIVNDTLARRAFPNQAAIGQQVRLIGGESAGKDRGWEIIGVVADLREESLQQPAPPTIYVPLMQRPAESTALLVRTAGNAEEITASIRRQIMSLDSEQPIFGIRPMEQLVVSEIDLHRLSLVLLVVFAVLSLLLAIVGLYSVVAHAVGQRTKEFGVRMALGAGSAQILRMVLREGAQMIALGVGCGVVAALWLTRFLQSLLYGVGGTDPMTFAVVSLLLAVVAQLACYIPARRATRVDPIMALRYE